MIPPRLSRLVPPRVLRAVLAVVLLACLPIAVRGWDILAGTNFHAVVEGRFYRSGQMSGKELERCIQDYHIQTVVNLRGAGPDAAWYQEETAACGRLGVAHFDVRLSAKELPPPEEARRLLDILRTAREPILVHCRNGADRAGLAAAAFLIVHKGASVERAVGQELSLYYGHMPVGPTQAMDRFFGLYKGDSPANSFAAWVQHAYTRDQLHTPTIPTTFDSASAR